MVLKFLNPGGVTCKDWKGNGFECVNENVCGEDGHFDAQTMQAAIGVRHDDENFNQVITVLQI